MGYNLGFIGFDRQPHLGELRALTKFRLFKRSDRSEWYLDGPNRGAEVIPLFERPSIEERRFGDIWTNATQGYSSLVAEAKRHGYRCNGLDYKLIPTALALSAALNTRLLVASGDDDELDCGFICSNGQLVSGRFVLDEEKALVFNRAKGSQVIQPDWCEGRFLYELMGAVASEYFGTGDAMSYASGWQEMGQNEYVLVHQRQ